MARVTLASRSCRSATVAVATYGMLCAMASRGMSLPVPKTLPGFVPMAGVVAVLVAVGGAHGRVKGVARAERFPAALAGPVAAGQRVGSGHRRLHRPVLRIEQSVTDRQRAGLIEPNLLVAFLVHHVLLSSTGSSCV